jgi:hypothetical protein
MVWIQWPWGMKQRQSRCIESAKCSVAASGSCTLQRTPLQRSEAVVMQPTAYPAERDKALTMPLAQIDACKGYLCGHVRVGLYFERLRREDSVHLAMSKRYAAYWSRSRATRTFW